MLLKGGNIMELNLETILKVVDFIMGLIRGLMEKGLLEDLL